MRIGHGIALVALTLALGTTGCKKKAVESGAGSDGSGSGSAMMNGSGSGETMGSGSGSAMAGSGSATDGSGSAAMAGSGSAAGSGSDANAAAMAHKAGMCPSTVELSTTKAEAKGGKVMVTVTSDDKDAIAAIQKRTAELLKEKADNMGTSGKTSNEHDQKGAHGGGMGLCPVHVPEGATAAAKTEAKGVVVTITPKDPKDADALKSDIDGRITRAAEWVKANLKAGDQGTTGGVGGGSGKHGSNHSGSGDAKGKERTGGGSGAGTGGGGGKGTGGGSGSGAKK
jgi:hypothetical protein